MKKILTMFLVLAIMVTQLLNFPYTASADTPIHPQGIFTSAKGNCVFSLMSDGTVKAWGSGQLGLGDTTNQTSPVTVPGLSNVKQLAVGEGFTLALMNDGTVKAWGYNDDGELGTGNTTEQLSPVTVTGLSNVRQLAAGDYHALALMNDGTVKAWGYNGDGELGTGDYSNHNTPVNVSGLYNVKQLVAGTDFSLALMNDGTVKAWGGNDYGELGTGNWYWYNTPVTVAGLSNVKQLSAGFLSSFALMDDGTVKAWGANFSGGLGINSDSYLGSPTTLPALSNVTQLSTGYGFSLVLLNDGTVKAWGCDVNGELGTDQVNQGSLVTVPGLSNVKQVSAGYGFSLSLMNDGTIKAWGDNDCGSLGIGNTTQKTSPIIVSGLSSVLQLSSGDYHSLILMDDGTVKAWGRNYEGELGIGNSTKQSLPVTVPGLYNIKQLSAGSFFSLALLNDGTIKACGTNSSGQLGIGSIYQQNSPVAIPGLSNVKQLSVGVYHSLALMNDGTVKAWGDNSSGQLGIGSTTQQNSPVTIPGLSNVKQLVAGDYFSLALMNDGTIKAWGDNDCGSLGIGNTTRQLSPVTVPGLSNVKQLSAGNNFSSALMNDGTVMAWGDNSYGQLGIGNTTQHLSPVIVPGLSNVKQLSVGNNFSSALMNDGTVKAWGYNYYGQLGIGNTTNQISSVTVPNLSNVSQLSAGCGYSLALMNNGTVKVWGDNSYGQLGIFNYNGIFQVDMNAPTMTITAPSYWGTTNTIIANISDDQSGFEIHKWAIGKNLPASFFDNNGTTFTGSSFTVSQNGDYTVYAKDNAGNVTTQTVTVDHILPSSTIGSCSKDFTNMKVSSPGMDMNLGITYNSDDTTTGPFGKGLTFSYSGSIKNYEYKYSTTTQNGNDQTATMSGLKVVKLPDGSIYYFSDDDNDGIYTAYNTTDKLTQNSDGTYSLVTSDKITYTFNTNGYLSSITDRNSNTIRIDVDSNGKVNSVTDTAGRVYTLSYSTNAITLTDPINRIVTYNLQNGNLTAITDPMGVTINQFGYDASGFLSNIKDGLNNTVDSVSYDHVNKDRILSLTDENSNIVNYTYNDCDNSVTSTDANNNQEKTWYNNTNQIAKSQSESGDKTFYVYDENGNLITQAVPKNGTDEYTEMSDQSLFDITLYQYDANWNVLNVSYPDGTTEAYTYDNDNNMLTQKDKDGTMTYYQYDTKGNVKLTAVRKSGTDDYSDSLTNEQKQNFDITQNTYYSNGLVNVETDPDGTTITYSDYDNGNPKTVANSSSGTTTYVYNALGWVTSKTTSDGKVTSNDYNNNGVVIRSKVGNDVTRFIYDTNGRLIQEIDPAQYNVTKDGLPSTDTYSDSNVGIRYSYDTHNNILSKTDAKNFTTNYVYDSHNNLVKSVYNSTDVTRYIYDSDGKLIQQINPDQYNASKDGWTGENPVNTYDDTTVGYRYTYDSDGNKQTETYPSGQVFNFDSSGKVTSIQNNATGSSVTGISYTYDVNNNIQTISENGTQKVKYYYDTNNQLERENNVWENQTITYAYDDRGNILTKSVYNYTTEDTITEIALHVYSYSYTDTSNIDKLTSYGDSSIGYDSNGHMTNFNGWTYTWNGDNLNTSTNGTKSISYEYIDGFRTHKTVDGITTTYTLDGDNNITSETNGTDTINYSRDVNGNLLRMTFNGTKYTYETNAQGDIIGLIDSSNTEVVRYSYDSWGKLLNIGGSLASTIGIQNPFRYRSYYYDTETGLYYLQSRYYNPEINRFISKDDASYHEDVTGVEANLYAYANNNPVMNYDSDGHLPLRVWCAISGAIIGGIYNLVYYLTHTPKYNRTFKTALVKFLRGAIAGGIVGLLLTGKAALIDGAIGAMGGIAGYLGSVSRNRSRFSTWGFIRAASGGFAGGVVAGKITSYIKVGNFNKAVDALIGNFVGSYVTEW